MSELFTSVKLSVKVRDELAKYRDSLEAESLGRISINEALVVLLDRTDYYGKGDSL